jgi:hypothetical protein
MCQKIGKVESGEYQGRRQEYPKPCILAPEETEQVIGRKHVYRSDDGEEVTSLKPDKD